MDTLNIEASVRPHHELEFVRYNKNIENEGYKVTAEGIQDKEGKLINKNNGEDYTRISDIVRQKYLTYVDWYEQEAIKEKEQKEKALLNLDSPDFFEQRFGKWFLIDVLKHKYEIDVPNNISLDDPKIQDKIKEAKELITQNLPEALKFRHKEDVEYTEDHFRLRNEGHDVGKDFLNKASVGASVDVIMQWLTLPANAQMELSIFDDDYCKARVQGFVCPNVNSCSVIETMDDIRMRVFFKNLNKALPDESKIDISKIAVGEKHTFTINYAGKEEIVSIYRNSATKMVTSVNLSMGLYRGIVIESTGKHFS